MKSILLTISGFLLLGVGFVGVFLPLLPTTPFVLAASACFTGNPTLRNKLLRSKFFHEHVTNYQQRTGLKKSTVFISLAVLWGGLSTSMIAMGKLWAVFLLSAVGIAVTVHILWIARPRG